MRRALATLALLLAAAAPAAADTLTVEVEGAKDASGQIVVAVWATPDGFGKFDLSKATTTAKAAIKNGTASVTFEKLAPGSYAVSAFHDADSTGTLKTNFIGMPKEGVALANNPGGFPRFVNAVVAVRGTAKARMKLRYL